MSTILDCRSLFAATTLADEEKNDGDISLNLDSDGYLVFAPGDLRDPRQWSISRKCYISAISILLVINATFASSAPTANIAGISRDFNVSAEAAGLVTTTFLLGYCAGPLVWAPLSEFYGSVLRACKGSNTYDQIAILTRFIGVAGYFTSPLRCIWHSTSYAHSRQPLLAFWLVVFSAASLLVLLCPILPVYLETFGTQMVEDGQ